MLFPAVYLEAVQVWQLQFLVHTLGLILQKVVDLSNSPVEGNDSEVYFLLMIVPMFN